MLKTTQVLLVKTSPPRTTTKGRLHLTITISTKLKVAVREDHLGGMRVLSVDGTTPTTKYHLYECAFVEEAVCYGVHIGSS